MDGERDVGMDGERDVGMDRERDVGMDGDGGGEGSHTDWLMIAGWVLFVTVIRKVGGLPIFWRSASFAVGRENPSLPIGKAPLTAGPTCVRRAKIEVARAHAPTNNYHPAILSWTSQPLPVLLVDRFLHRILDVVVGGGCAVLGVVVG